MTLITLTTDFGTSDPWVGIMKGVIASRAPGMLSLVEGDVRRIIELTDERFCLSPRSATFHGRDVFAPVAAALATGTEPAALGPTVPRMERLDVPRPVSAGDGLRGQVIYVDRFGNLTTNVTETDLRAFPRSDLCISIAEARLRGVAVSYGAVSRGQAVAVVNSWGLLEVAVRDVADGRFIPGLTMYATLLDHNGVEIGTHQQPFLWHSWMYHYGRNW